MTIFAFVSTSRFVVIGVSDSETLSVRLSLRMSPMLTGYVRGQGYPVIWEKLHQD